MKLGIFTDSHYSSAELTCGCRYNNQSLEKIREAYRIFEGAGCDLVLCLGDLTDTEKTYEQECENLLACKAVIDASPIPTLCLMGNHDAFVFTEEAFTTFSAKSTSRIPYLRTTRRCCSSMPAILQAARIISREIPDGRIRFIRIRTSCGRRCRS